jgi:hypothetical protein
MMSRHVLIVGDPGAAPQLLRAELAPALTLTVLCLTGDIPQLPGLGCVDRILATGPLEESSEAWIATAVSAHLASPITQVVVFDPDAYSRAVAVADVLGIQLYPRLGFRAIGDHWALRQRLRTLGQHAIVTGALARDGASLERYVAEHGLPCLLRSRYADRAALRLETVDDVDRAIRGKAGPVVLGEGMVVEAALDGGSFRVAVLVESGRSAALAVLRPDSAGSQPYQVSAGPVDIYDEDVGCVQLAKAQASELASSLGVRDGLLTVDLGLGSGGWYVDGVRLGPPDGQTLHAVSNATGVDLTRCCVQQICGMPALELALRAADSFVPRLDCAPEYPVTRELTPWS